MGKIIQIIKDLWEGRKEISLGVALRKKSYRLVPKALGGASVIESFDYSYDRTLETEDLRYHLVRRNSTNEAIQEVSKRKLTMPTAQQLVDFFINCSTPDPILDQGDAVLASELYCSDGNEIMVVDSKLNQGFEFSIPLIKQFREKAESDLEKSLKSGVLLLKGEFPFEYRNSYRLNVDSITREPLTLFLFRESAKAYQEHLKSLGISYFGSDNSSLFVHNNSGGNPYYMTIGLPKPVFYGNDKRMDARLRLSPVYRSCIHDMQIVCGLESKPKLTY